LGRGLKRLLGFLTIVPVKTQQDSLEQASRYVAAFPLVGAFIGLVAGGVAWGLQAALPPLVTGFLTLGVILLATGLHHTDGLLDLGDALILQGTAEEKLRVMHDQNTGAGGFGLGLIALSVTAVCIGGLTRDVVVFSLVVCEVGAKFSMVLLGYAGVSASEGCGRYFVTAMHERLGPVRLLGALFFSLVVCFFLLRAPGVLALIAASASSLILAGVSKRQFGGVTGDVFGAANEVGRMAALLTVVGVLRWL